MKRRIGSLAVVYLIIFSTFFIFMISPVQGLSIDVISYDLVWGHEGYWYGFYSSYSYVWVDISTYRAMEVAIDVAVYARDDGIDYEIGEDWSTHICERGCAVKIPFYLSSHHKSADMYWLKIEVDEIGGYSSDAYRSYNIEIQDYDCEIKILSCPEKVEKEEDFNVTVYLYDHRGINFVGDIIVKLGWQEIGRKSVDIVFRYKTLVIPCHTSVSKGTYEVRASIKDNKSYIDVSGPDLFDEDYNTNPYIEVVEKSIPAFEFAFLIIAIAIILLKRRKKRNQ